MKKDTIERIPADICTGCGLCSCVCPRQCITMKPNDEGFLYPKIDASACVLCGLCLEKCPVAEEQAGLFLGEEQNFFLRKCF